MSIQHKNKLKVLHIITRLIIGGAQENTILSIKGLQSYGNYDLSLLSGPQTGPEGSLIEQAAAACKLHIIPELKRNINPFYDLIAFVKLIIYLKKNKFDIIHTHSSKAGILGRWAAKLAGIKIIVHTVHGWGHNDHQTPIIRFLYVLLEKITLSITNRLIAVSEVTINKGIESGIGEKAAYTLIYSGIELDRFKNPKIDQTIIRKKLGIPLNVPVVATVTRLCKQKAPFDFIKSCAIISKEKPAVWFVIVGDGPLMNQSVCLVKNLALQKKLIFTGLRNDIPEIMSTFNIFVLSSLWEGLPRVLPQAMSQGIPIVTTNSGGNSEAVIDNFNGLIVPPGDYASLAQAVLTLLNDPKRSALLGENGLEIVNKFSAKKMVRDIDALYKELS